MKTQLTPPPEVLGSPSGSAIRPWDHRGIARMLREEASSADGWAEAHSDGISVTSKGTPKRDNYRRKAAAYRNAAEALESISQNDQGQPPATGGEASNHNQPLK